MSELNLSGIDVAPSLLNMVDVFTDAICALQPPVWQWQKLAAHGLGGPVRIPNGTGGTDRYWAWNRARLASIEETFLRRLYSVAKYSAGERDGRQTEPQPGDRE